MCMASVRDCRALADAQPVDVTKAKIPWVMRSQAGKRGKRQEEISMGHDCTGFTPTAPPSSSCLWPCDVSPHRPRAQEG